MATTIHIEDLVTPAMTRLGGNISPARVNARIAPAVARLITLHLAAKETEGNKNGWPSQHFYADAVRGLSYRASEASVTVSILKQGFRQRVEGGDIKPVNTKYLTIPARAEACGRRAREFDNLEVLFGRNGPYALAAKTGGAQIKVFGRRQASGSTRPVPGAEEGVVMFWLVKEAHQDADPTVLPGEDQIINAALAAVDDYVALLKRRNS